MKTSPRLLALFAPLCLVALIATSLLATTASAIPVSGSMAVGVGTFLFQSTTTGTPSDDASWTTVPASVSVSASLLSVSPAGSTANAFASGSATWAANGNSGTAIFDYGWTSVDGGDYPYPGMQTNLNTPNWSYTFTADATGFFVMNYAITAPGGLSHFGGLQNFYIGSDGGSTINLFDVGSGTYTQAVTAGVTYNVAFQNGGNDFDEVGYNAGVHAKFNWTLPGNTVVTPVTPGGGSNSVPDGGSTGLLFLFGVLPLVSVAARLRPAPFSA